MKNQAKPVEDISTNEFRTDSRQIGQRTKCVDSMTRMTWCKLIVGMCLVVTVVSVTVYGESISITNIRYDHSDPSLGPALTTDGLRLRKDAYSDLSYHINGGINGGWSNSEYRKNVSPGEMGLYVANSYPTFKVRFTSDDLTFHTTKVWPLMGGGLPSVPAKNILFINGVSRDLTTGDDYVPFGFSYPIPNSLRNTQGTQISWWYEDSNQQTQFADYSKFEVYVVLDVPKMPWWQDSARYAWTKVLDLLIDDVWPPTAGLNNQGTISAHISDLINERFLYEHVNATAGYHSSATPISFRLQAFTAHCYSLDHLVDCHDCGYGQQAFTSILGFAGTMRHAHKFGYIHPCDTPGWLRQSPTQCNNPTYLGVQQGGVGPRLNTNYDQVVGGPLPWTREYFEKHFFFTLSYNSRIYDPCLGSNGNLWSTYMSLVRDDSHANEKTDFYGIPFITNHGSTVVQSNNYIFVTP